MPAVPAPPPADGSSTHVPPPAATSQGGHEPAVPQVTHVTTAALLSNSAQEDKDDLADRNLYGGNRWPRQETLALLKIRSQMDAAFRDSSLKAPLWDDVSRKLGELGYYRSAKKCREKFENVYKYHRRTKEGRSAKHEGKTYRFFDELEAFDLLNNHSSSIPPKPQAILWPNNMNNNNSPSHVIISPHAHVTNIMSQNGPDQTSTLPAVSVSHQNTNGFNFKQNLSSSNLFSSSTSSTASDKEFQVQQRDKKKRKWKYFFRRLTKEVLKKQEKLQEKFLEAIAKCEHERTVREQVWRMEEMARMDKEHQILAQERASAAAKDAAVIEFLQKVSGQQGSPNTVQSLEVTSSRPPPLPVVMPPPLPPPQPAAPVAVVTLGFEVPRLDNGETKFPTGSTRWPRVEVEALINLRACLDVKYQEAGPKGSLWEEISAGMKRIGYNRSAKRCKEKWENINKYYKKVKESSKTRSEDSKTCPYFHQLEALYQKKMKMNNINNNNISNNNINHIVGHVEKPLVEKMQPLIEVHQPVVQVNGDRNEDEEDGESTEEEDRRHDDDDRDETTMEIVINYKGSSMET